MYSLIENQQIQVLKFRMNIIKSKPVKKIKSSLKKNKIQMTLDKNAYIQHPKQPSRLQIKGYLLTHSCIFLHCNNIGIHSIVQ